ncbi:hypothetical protein BpHYR1_013156 [Brachionus plicatilis]|uniref:Uncharacterized protein n=1 Tax=Brachionus plicatilis TaxID=10195 RepID=A0A3M7RQT4_BRAPC|nr:hypothetical protein BpHYR1_013156 [Brachionus plicatilis]
MPKNTTSSLQNSHFSPFNTIPIPSSKARTISPVDFGTITKLEIHSVGHYSHQPFPKYPLSPVLLSPPQLMLVNGMQLGVTSASPV